MIYFCSRVLCTPGENPKEKVLVQRGYSEGPNARKNCERMGGRQEDWKMSGELVLRVDGGVDD
jgi:hypothetical protein